MKVKILAKNSNILEITQKGDSYLIKFENEEVDLNKIMELIEKKKAKYLPKVKLLEYKGDILSFFEEYGGEI